MLPQDVAYPLVYEYSGRTLSCCSRAERSRHEDFVTRSFHVSTLNGAVCERVLRRSFFARAYAGRFDRM